MIREKLQLILITYNRMQKVENTLKQIFAVESPVRDCDFWVIDNNSTDNTEEVVRNWQKNFSNIRYVKNRYNVGLAGNIVKAMEAANKDYLWILGDDDKYDFSNWQEVEAAINNNEKMICVARYILPDEFKNNIEDQFFQLTFITGGIYSTDLFTDDIIRNAYDNIFTLFPHMTAVVHLINNGGRVYVIDKAVSDNGMDLENTDCSYIRGHKGNLYPRANTMSWIIGYAAICQGIKNKELRERIFMRGVLSRECCGGIKALCHYSLTFLSKKDLFMQIAELYTVAPKCIAKELEKIIMKNVFKKRLFVKESNKKRRYFRLFNNTIRISIKK